MLQWFADQICCAYDQGVRDKTTAKKGRVIWTLHDIGLRTQNIQSNIISTLAKAYATRFLLIATS
jgi:hypothetical protein